MPVTQEHVAIRAWSDILPPYRVLLHNDDVNTMDHVVAALVKAIPGLGVERAVAIMLEAHHHGVAKVVVCPLEQAELYRDRLKSFRLTSTIEPDR
ncbi:MAG: ATP-dependent Clp protease adaptor ClpS [Dehalococcoidia bacterium]|nr:ATP-dependent Clp protease adaptor ClpS [Dehalococcoidia bacterium]